MEVLSREEILKKAIEKAVENGWKNPFNTAGFQLSDRVWGASIPAIIYRHDFAKAFWGEERPEPTQSGSVTFIHLTKWQSHLQQMVLEEDPIKYLEQFI